MLSEYEVREIAEKKLGGVVETPFGVFDADMFVTQACYGSFGKCFQSMGFMDNCSWFHEEDVYSLSKEDMVYLWTKFKERKAHEPMYITRAHVQ